MIVEALAALQFLAAGLIGAVAVFLVFFRGTFHRV
jgi:hypothetical protein